MGQERKVYTDKLRCDVVRESLRSGGKQADAAVAHDISPGRRQLERDCELFSVNSVGCGKKNQCELLACS